MLSADLRSAIDTLWDRLWAGGLTNPVTVIDQLSCLLFLHRVDEQDLVKLRSEGGASLFAGSPELAWRAWHHRRGDDLLHFVRDDVFAWMRAFAGEDPSLSTAFQEASLVIPTPELLERAVAVIDRIGGDGETHDAAGDVFEHILSKLSVAGHLGQFRTPSHLVRLCCELVAPTDEDLVCDPASGTASFLIAAHEVAPGAHLVGWDVDPHMLRIATMNLAARGVSDFEVAYRNSLTAVPTGPRPTVVLANPPFAGTVDTENLAGFRVSSRRSEVLFLDRIEALLASGGRAAVVVPDGVASAKGAAQTALRQRLVAENRLEAVISLPAGVFRPYTGVSCSILVWSKQQPGDSVWMYEMQDDGFTLDDRRSPTGTSDVPALLAAWPGREATSASRSVPVAEIAAMGWRLTPSWYLRRAPVVAATSDDVVAAAARAVAAAAQVSSHIERLSALVGGAV